MINENGKIRKYVFVLAFIGTFIALYITLNNAKEWPIILTINLFLYTILVIDIIDCLIKTINNKPVAMARHGIGIIFIFPIIVSFFNGDYDFNLEFMSIVLYAYDIYTLVFYIAVGYDTGEYDLLHNKKSILKGFILDAPPKYIVATISMIIAQKADYKTNSATGNNEMKFDLDTLKTSSKIAFVCIFVYVALLILFIVIDVLKRVKNNNKSYKRDDDFYDAERERKIEEFKQKFGKMNNYKPNTEKEYEDEDYIDEILEEIEKEKYPED